jgi:transcriptional regulator with XRE-family HTH domain
LPFCHAQLRGPRPLPRSYPQVLAKIGDHLRKRRLDLGLLQREVSEQLGVDHCTITSWELNRTKPALRCLPRIIRFLNYMPFAPGRSLPERLRVRRRNLGLSQRELARMLEVDESTLARWERGTRQPVRQHLDRVEAFLVFQLPAVADLPPRSPAADRPQIA